MCQTEILTNFILKFSTLGPHRCYHAQLFGYVENTMEMFYYHEKVKINSSDLWTRNRRQNTLLHTREKKQKSQVKLSSSSWLYKKMYLSLVAADTYFSLFTIKMHIAAINGIADRVATKIQNDLSL